jgi:hypothetical protein
MPIRNTIRAGTIVIRASTIVVQARAAASTCART